MVDSQGHMLTNHHVVPGPRRIRVRCADRREVRARLVGSDPSTDVALLKIEARGMRPVRLGNSDSLRVGDWVAPSATRCPSSTRVTVGVVSSKGRKIWDPSFDAYIQTDAAINPGNSGGPCEHARGEAVGINSAMSREGQGIGFAMPVNLAREVMAELRAHGRVRRGYLGMQLDELDPDVGACWAWASAPARWWWTWSRAGRRETRACSARTWSRRSGGSRWPTATRWCGWWRRAARARGGARRVRDGRELRPGAPRWGSADEERRGRRRPRPRRPSRRPTPSGCGWPPVEGERRARASRSTAWAW